MPLPMPRAPRFLPLLLAASITAIATAMGGPAASPKAAAASAPVVPPQPPAAAPGTGDASSSASSACPIGEDVALSSRRCAGARFLYHEVVQVCTHERREKGEGGKDRAMKYRLHRRADGRPTYPNRPTNSNPQPHVGPPGGAAGGRGDHRERAGEPGQERRLPRGACAYV